VGSWGRRRCAGGSAQQEDDDEEKRKDAWRKECLVKQTVGFVRVFCSPSGLGFDKLAHLGYPSGYIQFMDYYSVS